MSSKRKLVGSVVDPSAELPQEDPECPACGGPAMVMGTLGKLRWFRCRNCGTEFNQEAKNVPLQNA